MSAPIPSWRIDKQWLVAVWDVPDRLNADMTALGLHRSRKLPSRWWATSPRKSDILTMIAKIKEFGLHGRARQVDIEDRQPPAFAAGMKKEHNQLPEPSPPVPRASQAATTAWLKQADPKYRRKQRRQRQRARQKGYAPM